MDTIEKIRNGLILVSSITPGKTINVSNMTICSRKGLIMGGLRRLYSENREKTFIFVKTIIEEACNSICKAMDISVLLERSKSGLYNLKITYSDINSEDLKIIDDLLITIDRSIMNFNIGFEQQMDYLTQLMLITSISETPSEILQSHNPTPLVSIANTPLKTPTSSSSSQPLSPSIRECSYKESSNIPLTTSTPPSSPTRYGCLTESSFLFRRSELIPKINNKIHPLVQQNVLMYTINPLRRPYHLTSKIEDIPHKEHIHVEAVD
jgi:hypothetical protein